MDQEHCPEPAAESTVRFSAAVLDDDAIQQLLQQVTVLARHTVSCAQSVSLTVAQGDRYRTSNSTGPEALAVDDAQYEQDDGPCLHSMRSRRQLQVRVDDQRDRWPRFHEEATQAGIAGVLSTPLLANGGDAIGALNVYATTGSFGEGDQQTAMLIGEHARILVESAIALADSSQRNEQLRQAVATREVIGMAKGILMQNQSCTRDEAFDMLRRASQRENRKLREIAEELVRRVEARATGNASRV